MKSIASDFNGDRLPLLEREVASDVADSRVDSTRALGVKLALRVRQRRLEVVEQDLLFFDARAVCVVHDQEVSRATDHRKRG